LFDGLRNHLRRSGKPIQAHFSKLGQLVRCNILPFFFSESVEEDSPVRAAICDDGAISTGTPLAGASHSLFDEPAAKIGVYQSRFRSDNGFLEAGKLNLFASFETCHRFRNVDLHGPF